MPNYRLTGNLTFSSNTSRNSAQVAIQAQIDAHGGAVAWGDGTYSAGLVRGGTGQLTVAYSVPDEASAIALERAIMGAISSWARSAGHLSISRGST